MTRLTLIFLGGGAGSVLRYLLAGWVQPLAGLRFPLGTLTVNLLGCIAIGFLMPLLTGPFLARDEYRLALVVGLLGGFTTFSAFSWETISLTNDRQFFLAGLNILLSSGLGLAATWLSSRIAAAVWGP